MIRRIVLDMLEPVIRKQMEILYRLEDVEDHLGIEPDTEWLRLIDQQGGER